MLRYARCDMRDVYALIQLRVQERARCAVAASARVYCYACYVLPCCLRCLYVSFFALLLTRAGYAVDITRARCYALLSLRGALQMSCYDYARKSSYAALAYGALLARVDDAGGSESHRLCYSCAAR